MVAMPLHPFSFENAPGLQELEHRPVIGRGMDLLNTRMSTLLPQEYQ